MQLNLKKEERKTYHQIQYQPFLLTETTYTGTLNR